MRNGLKLYHTHWENARIFCKIFRDDLTFIQVPLFSHDLLIRLMALPGQQDYISGPGLVQRPVDGFHPV